MEVLAGHTVTCPSTVLSLKNVLPDATAPQGTRQTGPCRLEADAGRQLLCGAWAPARSLSFTRFYNPNNTADAKSRRMHEPLEEVTLAFSRLCKPALCLLPQTPWRVTGGR